MPSVDVLMSGFVCSGRSRLNNKRKLYENCIAEACGDTGLTFEGTANYLQMHRPALCILEHVVDLEEGGSSDLHLHRPVGRGPVQRQFAALHASQRPLAASLLAVSKPCQGNLATGSSSEDSVSGNFEAVATQAQILDAPRRSALVPRHLLALGLSTLRGG